MTQESYSHFITRVLSDEKEFEKSMKKGLDAHIKGIKVLDSIAEWSDTLSGKELEEMMGNLADILAVKLTHFMEEIDISEIDSISDSAFRLAYACALVGYYFGRRNNG